VGGCDSCIIGYVATHFLAEQPVSNCLQRRFENMLAINLQPDEDPIFQVCGCSVVHYSCSNRS